MQNLTTLSASDLATVTGGKDTKTASTSTSGSSGDDALIAAIQGIQSSLKDINTSANQGLFGGNHGLLFLTMALAMNSRRSETVVYAGRHGYSWRSYW